MRRIDGALDSLCGNHQYFKDQIQALQAEKKALEEQLRVQAREIETLKSGRLQAQEQMEQRKIRLILLASVLNNTLRDNAALVRCAFGESISHTEVARILSVFESRAKQLMDEYFRVGIDTGCLDEIFFHGDPVLVIVEALSHAIVAIEKRASRGEADWKELIETLPYLNSSVNDKGAGILSALEARGTPYQVDLYHLIQEGNRVLEKLEQKAYHLIAQEERFKKQLAHVKRVNGRWGPNIHVAQKITKAQREFEEVAEMHETVEWLLQEMSQAFSWVRASGRLNTPQELLKDLDVLAEWIEELEPPRDKKWVRYFDTPSAATFLSRLHEKLKAIDTTNPFGLSHELLIEHVGHIWLASENKIQTRPLHLELRGILLEAMLKPWEGYDMMKTKITEAFQTTHRSSSAVENVNSRLRLYNHVKKHVGDTFLRLVALYHNMTPFKDGAKREGKSPAQLLGLKLPTFDFFELLGLSPIN